MVISIMKNFLYVNFYWNGFDGYDLLDDFYVFLINLNNEVVLRFILIILFIVVLMIIELVGNVIVCIIYYK